MTNDDYREMIEFLGRKFDAVDARFEAVDRRLDQMATKEEVRAQHAETRRHFEVVAERRQSQIQTVAEGVAATNGRLDRLERRMEEGFAETGAAVRFSYAQLERRIQELEANYVALSERVGRLEARTA